MDIVHVQLKLQALQITMDHQKAEILRLNEELNAYHKSLKALDDQIKDINFSLNKKFISFESLGKRMLFLASLFGALQVLFRIVAGLFK